LFYAPLINVSHTYFPRQKLSALMAPIFARPHADDEQLYSATHVGTKHLIQEFVAEVNTPRFFLFSVSGFLHFRFALLSTVSFFCHAPAPPAFLASPVPSASASHPSSLSFFVYLLNLLLVCPRPPSSFSSVCLRP
jgi:hypothetical protein